MEMFGASIVLVCNFPIDILTVEYFCLDTLHHHIAQSLVTTMAAKLNKIKPTSEENAAVELMLCTPQSNKEQSGVAGILVQDRCWIA